MDQSIIKCIELGQLSPYKNTINHVWMFVQLKLKDRIKCHGYEHALHIAEVALTRAVSTNPYLNFIIYMVALLHDVADHKFDMPIDVLDELVGVVEDEFCIISKFMEQIKHTIQCVSFSKEQRALKTMNREQYDQEFLNSPCFKPQTENRLHPSEQHAPLFLVALKAVRYADRLDAIGKIGIIRCGCFNLNENRRISSPEQLYQCIIEHREEKLSILVKEGYLEANNETIAATEWMTDENIKNICDTMFHQMNTVGFNPYNYL